MKVSSIKLRYMDGCSVANSRGFCLKSSMNRVAMTGKRGDSTGCLAFVEQPTKFDFVIPLT